ncbi:MAG TPA: TIGR03767 family metallophosphoesterase [Nitriliruptorales bacterium]
MSSSRTRPRRPLTRREFIRRSTALAAGAWAVPQLTGSGLRNAWAQTAAAVLLPAGTTLERTIVTVPGDGPYFTLTYGPGWPIVVRDELAAPKAGREDRRVALVSFLHVTDYQLADAQSPARVEFVDRTVDPPSGFVPFGAAQRPQEALVPHAVEALVRQSRVVDRGPVTGLPLGFTIATGDNMDNMQANELRWYFTLHNGGQFAPSSGAADSFEGVQSFAGPDTYDPHYWHPEVIDDPRAPDQYKQTYGFPDYPGLLNAAIAPFTATGLATPWYTAYGNHDALVQGNAPPNALFESFATGSVKILAPPPGITPQDFYRGLVNQDPSVVAMINVAPATTVTADPERHFVSHLDYIQAHLDSPATPGPVGHGFTQDNLDTGTLYYAFEVAPGIRGITLDTTSPASSEGSIDDAQLAWLEQRLIEVHSRYYDQGGTETTTGNADQIVVIFSHHRPASMPLPTTGATIAGGAAVLELLHRFPNVVLWVNGHSHFNRVVAQPDPQGRTGGFWDITTSAQVDPPQQARVLELVDNRDGTLSIFSTIIDHAAGPGTAVGAYDVLGLAAIGREVSFNDFQSDAAGSIGEPGDRNVELLVPTPFTLAAPPPSPTPEPAPQPPMPGTGGGALGAVAGAVAIAGAVALRSRTPPT